MKVRILSHTHIMDYNSSILYEVFYRYSRHCIKVTAIDNIIGHNHIYLFDLVKRSKWK